MADIALLTEKRYLNPIEINPYIENILKEDSILTTELAKLGLTAVRKAWDAEETDLHQTRLALFRTTWNYFDQFSKFNSWLDTTKRYTHFINDAELVKWNTDKFYLLELADKDISIPPTLWIEKGCTFPLSSFCWLSDWDEFVLKPAVSGAARLTHRFNKEGIHLLEDSFKSWIKNESFLLQQFLPAILSEGEISLMYMGGKFTHAICKKAKTGDFRVQDDFGGTVHAYIPSKAEISLGYRAIEACPIAPIYARVDLIKDMKGKPCVSELELIEPELWFRFHPPAARQLARSIARLL